jgi:hypothetical protein
VQRGGAYKAREIRERKKKIHETASAKPIHDVSRFGQTVRLAAVRQAAARASKLARTAPVSPELLKYGRISNDLCA